MPIESYTVIDGQRIHDPGDAPPTDSAAAGAGTDAPGATGSPQAGDGQPSASPPDTPPAEGGEPSAGETDDDEPLRDDSDVTAARLERRFARITAARRTAERERDAAAQQHQIELAQTRGQLQVLQNMMSGAAPTLPDTPAQPTGPPQADQFASHDEYVLAAARYGAQQEFQARDQQTAQQRQAEAQAAFQRELMSREQAFKQAHPDFDSVLRTGLAGKVSPILQQALMLVPDGPAIAYALARQPDLVQRLNTLPPPLVLIELGRLSGPGSASTTPAPQDSTRSGVQGSTNGNGAVPAPTLHAPETPLSGSGGGAPTGAYRDDMSQAEYAAWRKRTSQLEVWKKR